MRRIGIKYILLFFLIAGFCALVAIGFRSYLEPMKNKSLNTNSKKGYTFVHSSEMVTISDQDDGTYAVVLIGVSPKVEYFLDSAYSKGGEIDLERFITVFKDNPKDANEDDLKTAVLNVAEGANKHAFHVEILSKIYYPDIRTLRYVVRTLPGTPPIIPKVLNFGESNLLISNIEYCSTCF